MSNFVLSGIDLNGQLYVQVPDKRHIPPCGVSQRSLSQYLYFPLCSVSLSAVTALGRGLCCSVVTSRMLSKSPLAYSPYVARKRTRQSSLIITSLILSGLVEGSQNGAGEEYRPVEWRYNGIERNTE